MNYLILPNIFQLTAIVMNQLHPAHFVLKSLNKDPEALFVSDIDCERVKHCSDTMICD